MKIPKDIPLFGDTSYRGSCKKEYLEHKDFILWIRYKYPDYLSRLIHIKNEGARTGKEVQFAKSMGELTSSWPDIYITGKVDFCVELKRKDHTKSTISKSQIDALTMLKEQGKFTGVALGCDGLKEAFNLWIDKYE